MTVWNDIVIGLSLPVLVFLLWKETRRADRSRLGARVIATVMAVASLAAMGITMTHMREAVLASAAARSDGGGSGFVTADWQRQLQQGQRLAVQGRWRGPGVKILLTGLGATLDSAEGVADFVVHTVPAQSGRAVYRLVAVRGADTLEQEDVPVEVEPVRPLKVLVLASSPGFENRFLMNWLAAGGHEVAARISVSKDKYVLVNAPGRHAYDVVVADAGVLSEALRQEVEGGLGLVIRVDSAGKTIAGWHAGMVGAGRVVVSAGDSTYSWWMAGRRQEYAAYWSSLLQQAARKTGTGEEWRWRPALPRVGEPVEAELQTGSPLPQGIFGREAVYLGQDGFLPFLWRGEYWPETAGWQQVHTLKGDTAWWYAWPAGAWKAVKRGGAVVDAPIVREERAEIPKGWIYAVLLFSLAFLWVERKIV